MSVNATEQNFVGTVGEGLVLVDFWAAWCGPCKMLTPTLDRLEDELEGRLTVAKVNVDEESELAREFRVMSIPTMVLFNDGQPVKTIVGVKTQKVLKQELEDYL
jgi:thioredoxin 1